MDSADLRDASVTVEKPPGPGRTDMVLLLMVVIWAVNFSVIKVGLAELPPLAFNALRFPIAALVVLVVLALQGPVPLPRPEDRKRILFLGLFGNVVYQLLFIMGLDRTRAGNASLLLAGSPIMTALLSAAVGHERVGRAVWVGVVATVVGMALVIIGGRSTLDVGLETLPGDLMMVGASAAWAVYTVGAREPIARYGSVAVTAWTLWIGAVGIVLLGIPVVLRQDLGAVSAGAWASVAYAGAFGIGFAYLIWYHGVKRIGNTRTATYSNLVPVLALLVAWVWLDEVPTVWQVLGTIVIIGGVTLARRRP